MLEEHRVGDLLWVVLVSGCHLNRVLAIVSEWAEYTGALSPRDTEVLGDICETHGARPAPLQQWIKRLPSQRIVFGVLRDPACLVRVVAEGDSVTVTALPEAVIFVGALYAACLVRVEAEGYTRLEGVLAALDSGGFLGVVADGMSLP